MVNNGGRVIERNISISDHPCPILVKPFDLRSFYNEKRKRNCRRLDKEFINDCLRGFVLDPDSGLYSAPQNGLARWKVKLLFQPVSPIILDLCLDHLFLWLTFNEGFMWPAQPPTVYTSPTYDLFPLELFGFRVYLEISKLKIQVFTEI